MTPPYASFDDRALIELILRGRTECFDILMDRHLVALKKCISSMIRNATEGEDILQEVVIKAWRHLGSFRAESSFRTWLNRIAVNEALQSYRRGKCRPACQPPMDLDAFASPEVSVLATLVSSETSHSVRHAVSQLPEIYRQVLVLRDLEQLSSIETAQCLKATVSAVKSRLFRARNLLSKSLRARSRGRGWKKPRALAA